MPREGGASLTTGASGHGSSALADDDAGAAGASKQIQFHPDAIDLEDPGGTAPLASGLKGRCRTSLALRSGSEVRTTACDSRNIVVRVRRRSGAVGHAYDDCEQRPYSHGFDRPNRCRRHSDRHRSVTPSRRARSAAHHAARAGLVACGAAARSGRRRERAWRRAAGARQLAEVAGEINPARTDAAERKRASEREFALPTPRKPKRTRPLAR